MAEAQPPAQAGHPQPSAIQRQPRAAAVASSLAKLKLVGGLVALSLGLLAIVAVVALVLALTPSNATGVGTAAIAAAGTMVGAYFGVKIGTDGTDKAVTAMRQESAKAQAYALAVPDHQSANNAVAHAQTLMRAQGIDSEAQ
jgi:hypothetical protein